MEQLSCRPLTEKDKRQICGWRYDGAYGIYDLPSCEEMQTKQIGFMRPGAEKNFLAFWDQERLVGYVNLREKETEVRLGIGVKPELCNRQYGRRMLQCACELASRRFPGKLLALEVRVWNTRAIRCYEKAGFQVEGAPYERTTPIGSGVFCRMTKKQPER